jgi:hypothetical protein
VDNREWIDYDGYVYCVEVPNHVVYVRRNGKAVWSGNSTPLDYWMESKVDGDYAVFWVEIADDLSTNPVTIYIYYGNPNATTASNGANTFIFFDDFADLSQWTVISGSITIVDGSAHGATSATGNLAVHALANDNLAIFGRWQITDISANYRSVEFGYRSDSTYSVGYKSGMWRHSTLCSTSPYTAINIDKTNASIAHNCKTFSINTWYLLEVRAYGSTHKVEFNRDGSPLSGTDTTYTSGTHIVLRLYDVYSYVDWIAVRKYVDPEPSHGSWGSEETVAVAEAIVAKNFPMGYLPSPTKAVQLISKVSGATITTVSQDYPLTLIKKDKAAELRSKFST